MNRNPEQLQEAPAPTIDNNLELAYEYYFSVCESLSVSAMSVAQFTEQWNARRNNSPAEAPGTNPATQPSVSMRRSGSEMVVNIQSGGRDLWLRTMNGTSAELRSIAYEMEQDGLRRLRRAALVFAAANAVERSPREK